MSRSSLSANRKLFESSFILWSVKTAKCFPKLVFVQINIFKYRNQCNKKFTIYIFMYIFFPGFFYPYSEFFQYFFGIFFRNFLGIFSGILFSEFFRFFAEFFFGSFFGIILEFFFGNFFGICFLRKIIEKNEDFCCNLYCCPT